ncbi:MAG: NUDIX hydrolase [Candidatus Promineifilaceae bacterium]|jgi:ADP-ribose pyrophosphatase
MESWKTLSRKTILDKGKYLRVEDHTIELPDGRIIEDWPWIVTPDFVNVLAVTPQGQYLIFRQTKYSIDGTSLATIGGYIESEEDPLAAAQRELLEETGYTAENWTSLGSFPIDGNRGAGVAHYFLATDAQKVAKIDADDLEEQDLLLLGKDDLQKALKAGEFKLLPWMAIVALALQY